MLPIVLATCITPANQPRIVCVDNMAFTLSTRPRPVDEKPGLLSAILEAMNENAAAQEKEQLRSFEDRLDALKRKNDPADAKKVKLLEDMIKQMKGSRR